MSELNNSFSPNIDL